MIYLNDSGAKVIFIGTPQLLEHLMDFENEQTIISFYNDSFEHSSDILSWQEFLGVGEE